MRTSGTSFAMILDARPSKMAVIGFSGLINWTKILLTCLSNSWWAK